jgi:hypothetical protein
MGQAREERDRFGLPLIWSFIDDDQQFNERIAATKAFVAEAVEAVIRQVGRKGARALFLKALRTPPPGRTPKKEANERQLAAYYRQIALGLPPDRAARAAAEELATRPNDDAESFAHQIRTLVRKHETAKQRAEQEAEWLKKLSPPFLLDEDAELKSGDRPNSVASRELCGQQRTLQTKGVREWNRFSPT